MKPTPVTTVQDPRELTPKQIADRVIALHSNPVISARFCALAEWQIYRQVLEAIAVGAPNATELAAIALCADLSDYEVDH